MRNGKSFVLVSLLALGLMSCGSKSDKSKELVSDFFKAVSDTTYKVKASDVYPTFDSLHVAIKTDVLDLNDMVEEKNGEYQVSGVNNYTNERGVFKQDSVRFYIAYDEKAKDLRIVDSKGLVAMPEYLAEFSKYLGVTTKGMKDSKLSELASKLEDFYRSKGLDALIDLYAKVKISYWDWETSYSNEPHGQAWVVNNSDVTISNIKYIVSYYDSKDGFISDDTGTACSSLKPGEKYRFTFWTSHVKNPSRANLKLDFGSSNIEIGRAPV